MKSIYDTRVWQQLEDRARKQRSEGLTLSSLFGQDPDRADTHHIEAAGLYLNFSRHHLDASTLALLLALTEAIRLRPAIQAQFDGAAVNTSEQRPALHTALRGHRPARRPDIPDQVAAQLQQMETLCQALDEGRLTGATDRPIRSLVNIGIGGSHLGPALACEALAPFRRPHVHCHFVSNMDPADLYRTLQALDPATTLFLVASKSFLTEETLGNARAARQWLENAGIPRESTHRHFIAITAQAQRAREFGVENGRILPVHDWTGGRFSLWSAIGLPVAMMIGMTAFRELLDGAARMDQHFLDAPAGENMPVMLALLDIWNRLYLGNDSHAVLPYAQALARLPDFLQQLEMESLGKSVTMDGAPVRGPTGQVVWGSPGTNGQHSFHQLLHQGTQVVPVDFIAVARSAVPDGNDAHHRLLAHCLAQGEALMTGRSPEQVLAEMLAAGIDRNEAERLAPHRAIPGNRPSNTLLLPELNPRTLGSLLALYEHKVATLGVLWGIDAFDQWGVELGKALSGPLADALEHGATGPLDPVSRVLIDRIRRNGQGDHADK